IRIFKSPPVVIAFKQNSISSLMEHKFVRASTYQIFIEKTLRLILIIKMLRKNIHCGGYIKIFIIFTFSYKLHFKFIQNFYFFNSLKIGSYSGCFESIIKYC